MKIKQYLIKICLLGILLSAAPKDRILAQVLQSPGVNTNGFAFTVSWTTNRTVVVEATTNLTDPILTLWTPLATNRLSNGFFYFSDPGWVNYAERFYRITDTNAFAHFTASPADGAMPLTVQFSSPNFDSLGSTITSWNWNFGDGATSTAQNPLHTYANLGVFNPGFVATNNHGVVVAGYGPQITTHTFALFSASPTNGALPSAVQFNSPNVDNLGNAITNWSWNFGDGATSAAQNPSHTYTNLGAFTPVLAAVNNHGGAVICFGPPQIVTFSYRSTTNNGTITIAGFAGNLAGALTIPGTINGLPVTGIGISAFSGYSRMTSVTIPNSVTSIGESAFSGCANLSGVTIPNTVTSIGPRTFYFCPSLNSVTIPDSVTDIGDYAFSACGKLTNVVLGAGVTNIGSFAFAFDASLTGLTIPNSVITIGTNAFGYCSGLTSVTIPDSVTNLGDFAFNSCGNLSSVTIGAGVTNLGNLAFNFCTNLTGITIPGNVSSIGTSAFAFCSALGSATIDSSNIGDFAFSPCSSLSNVVIGNNVTNLGNFAFAFSPGLTGITIPGNITGIGVDAFTSCSNLTSVTINGGSIGDYAFSSCVNLSSVVLGSTVTNIGVGVFAGCSSLTNLTIPASLTDIIFPVTGN
jgi:PKD repeat protein